MGTYSFLDTNAAINGPGGSINLGQGAAVAEEGISITPIEPIDTLTIGAGGEGMHSLHANRAAKVTVRLLKTSPVNQKLAQMYAFQTASAANHGQNTFSLSNSHLGDVVACTQAAFEKAPDLTYAKEGGMNEWTFLAVAADRVLGSGA